MNLPLLKLGGLKRITIPTPIPATVTAPITLETTAIAINLPTAIAMNLPHCCMTLINNYNSNDRSNNNHNIIPKSVPIKAAATVTTITTGTAT